jgi:hypothetical protein
MLQVAVRPDTSSARGVDPGIADDAVSGDCRSAALISRSKSLGWLYLPHFSGPSLLAALLDRKRAGRFTIVLARSSPVPGDGPSLWGSSSM